MLEHLQVQRLRHRALEGDALLLEIGVEAHHPEAHRTLARGGILGAGHLVGRAVDVVLKNIVEEAHHVLDELLVALPLFPGLEVERGEAAHRRAVIAEVVDAGRQGDFRAQVRGRDLEPEIAVMLGHHAVHGVGEDDVGLTRRKPGLDQLLEQRARIDLAALGAVTRATQRELGALAHRLHELVGDEHAVVEVQRLAVEVARGFADLEELLDLGVRDVEVARGRTAAQRALADGQREAVHHAHEGNDPRGLAVEADRLADAADVAPIGADPAALGGEPHVLVPRADNPFEAVLDRVQVARDREAAVGAAVREHRGRGHEPQVRDVVVEPLGVRFVVGIGIGDAGEEVLIDLAGQQVAVGQRVLAEIGEARIAAGIGDDVEAAVVDLLAVGLGGVLHGFGHGAGQRLARLGGDDRVGSGITRFHRHSFLVPRPRLSRRARIRFIRHIGIHRIIRHVFARLEIHLKPTLSPESAPWHKHQCSDSVLYRPIHRLANRTAPHRAYRQVG